MDSSGPWWVSGLSALSGVVITSAVTVTLWLTTRRTDRRRLAWAKKAESYPELLLAVDGLARLPVWPVTKGDPEASYDTISQVAQRVRIFGGEQVKEPVVELLNAAHALATTIATIRGTGKPAHGDLIDQRDAVGHRQAVDALWSASERFRAASRLDLEVDPR